jgi:hypothetical protein
MGNQQGNEFGIEKYFLQLLTVEFVVDLGRGLRLANPTIYCL